METRHNVEQFKAYLKPIQNTENPLHDALKEEKECRLARGKSWMGHAEQSIQLCVWSRRAQASKVLGKKKRPLDFKLYYKTMLSENLGTLWREWPAAGKANTQVQILVEANSKPRDIVIYIHKDWSGWGFTVKQGGRIVHEDSGAHSHDLQSDHAGRSSHTCNTLASLPT